MSFFSSHRFAQPETSAWRDKLPDQQRERFTELDADYKNEWRSDCRRADCLAGDCASGGVATANKVAERLRVEVSQPVSLLARWIVDRHVIAFSCGAELMLPLFQFDFAQGCVRGGVAPVMLELTGVMSDEEMARWFAQPNGWLHGATPAQTLPSDAGAVLDAARADRFVANG